MFHVLPAHERAVVETLGRFSAVKGPGLVILVPVVQTMRRVDMREEAIELRVATVRYAVEDPAKALYAVADYRAAVGTLAETVMKRVLEGRASDALVFERAGIAEAMRKAMAEAAATWGIRIEKVEVNR